MVGLGPRRGERDGGMGGRNEVHRLVHRPGNVTCAGEKSPVSIMAEVEVKINGCGSGAWMQLLGCSSQIAENRVVGYGCSRLGLMITKSAPLNWSLL